MPKFDRLRKPSGAGGRCGRVSSISTVSSPLPWAVFNFDIFWVLVNSKGQCGGQTRKECGRQCGGNGHSSTYSCSPPKCHECSSKCNGCLSKCQGDGKTSLNQEVSNAKVASDSDLTSAEGASQTDEKGGDTFKCFIHRQPSNHQPHTCECVHPYTCESNCSNNASATSCGASKLDCWGNNNSDANSSNNAGVKDFLSSSKSCCHGKSSLSCGTSCLHSPAAESVSHSLDPECHCYIDKAEKTTRSVSGESPSHHQDCRPGDSDTSRLYTNNIKHCCKQSSYSGNTICCCCCSSSPSSPNPSPPSCHAHNQHQHCCHTSYKDTPLSESKERKLSRDSGVECDDVSSEPVQEESQPQGQSCSCMCSCGGGRLPLIRCPCIDADQVEALKEEARQLRTGDVTHREGSQVKGATMRVAGEGFSAHRSAISEQQQRQTKTPAGTINQESSRQAAKSGLTIKTKGVCTKQSSSMTASQSNISITGFDDLDLLNPSSQPVDIQNIIMRYSGVMSSFVEQLKNLSVSEGLKGAPTLLENIDEMLRKAWSVPVHGHELGFSLCNVLRTNGGMSILLENCSSEDFDLKFSSAKVLEQCLTTENRGYVVENGLENIVNVACDCTKNGTSVDKSRVGTGILEHLFKHNEGTCSDIIKLGGLDAVLLECRKSDIETLRHCAGALANLSLYGGSDNQQEMIQRNVPMWLFPLAFHPDENIKYYACLAIASLVANKELEAAVLQSGTLNLVEPFVSNQLPDQFANSTVAHRHGQSQNWLQRLLPVLSSKREEARNLAAFHFCMEAGIKKQQGNLDIFREIGAIEPLKEVASSPNAIASKYAVRALRLMGEEVPHKLSQQVPLWTPEDVREWVKQIGFSAFCEAFVSSRVDGDLLLQLTEENLRDDICIKNGILRQRFLRELKKLKHLADYSSCDSTRINDFLVEMDKEFAEYTYKMLQAGVQKEMLRYLTEEQLITECGIMNSIHRQRLRDFVASDGGQLQDANSLDKNLDIFISYRRSNGSQLASLLKVHMQLKEFSVFIDVERLEAGKFDNNLLNSVRQAKNFLLVLTPNSLDRCVADTDCKDWVHREIVAALQSGCNIIPILDNFQWPEPEELPEDMRAVCYFNGVRWIHDYQDACVDKIERFMRGECNVRGDGPLGRYVGGSIAGGMATPGTPSTLPRAPPLYQRTTSTESGKGSSCSDKDFTKD